jgi:methionyl-tRNA formyltransferase
VLESFVMDCRIIFMGSPEFSTPILTKLAASFLVVGVVTQPDRPSGRGRALKAPAIKELAQAIGVPVIQPDRLKDPGVFEKLKDWKPDLIVVAAFGQILRQKVLDLPQWGCINVHGSLLPKWRGAAPIQAAVAAGDSETGVTIMKMDAGVDTGAILAQRRIDILPEDTSQSLGRRLSETGASLLMETLPRYLTGEIIPAPQPTDEISYAPMLRKEDGLLDFFLPAEVLVRKVRAYHPWPGTYMQWETGGMKVLRAHVGDGTKPTPGSRFIAQGLPAVATSKNCLVLDEVQPAGKKPMRGDVFLNGAHSWTEINHNPQK